MGFTGGKGLPPAFNPTFADDRSPVISVVISNFNGLRFLPRLLDSLRAQRDVSLQIIVVDRHSNDGSIPFLKGQPDVQLLSEPPDSGLVSGYHRGLELARGDLLFFCNEDMWFDPYCLNALQARIDLSQRIGAVDPWQWSYDGSEWMHGATRYRRARWAINSPQPWRGVEFQLDLPAGSEIPFPCAGAVLIHRDVYREIGGWDTSFFLDHEDIDLFLRAWQRRWRCVVEPSAKVYHAINAANSNILPSTGKPVARRRYIGQRANLPIIAIKYFSAPWILPALAQWSVAFLNNLTAGRWQSVLCDLAIPAEIFRRFPAAWQFRRANAPYNTRFPGEHFFDDPRFQAPSEPPSQKQVD
jgi:GT2 family glycosyltransferase